MASASAARQSRPPGKKPAEPARRAWTGTRASTTYSTASSPSPRPTAPPTSTSSTQPAFPPLSQPNGARPDPPQDRVLQSLSGLTGTTITLRTKTGQHYEGAIASTNADGNTTGVTLRDVRDISTPGQPLKDTLFVASTNIGTWNSGPADAKAPNTDSFRTDIEISQKIAPRANRELQAWSSGADGPSSELTSGPGKGDEETFGADAGSGSWDQFAANEQLFGINPTFDESVYTTKIDRSGADYKERERKAQRIANEINGVASNNPHLAEERGQVVDDSGIDEENKYSTVVRGTNAYVPPGARRGNPTSPPPKSDVPMVSVNGPDGAAVQAPTQASPSSSKTASPAPPANATNKPPADAVPAFREFVNTEKQRLTQKKQALFKSEMDKRMADLVKFSQSFKLNKPIPDDLVSILAKDEAKQQAIRDKSSKDASSSEARTIGASLTNVAARAPAAKPAPAKLAAPGIKPSATSNAVPPANPPKAAVSTSKPEVSVTGKKLIPMVIQNIPAFRGSKKPDEAQPTKPSTDAPTGAAPANGAAVAAPSKANPPAGSAAAAAAAAANRLNVNASSFRPNPKAGTFSPGQSGPSPPGGAVQNGTTAASVSPKPKEPGTPNPFFGNRVIKKGTPIHVKDEFNPFKHNKINKSSEVSQMWPYSGKRYMTMFPTPSHQPQQQHSPHMAAPVPPPMPPPPYEEDAAAAQGRGYAYMYPSYAYPGQHMMPGMAPPGPPAGYIPAQFMQAIPYPHGMPPPGAMYSPAMGQMPPQGYMQPPPPGAYPPPPNGGGRPSMPPTPIPSHAHPYYPQSPQMPHAVPYPMMMPGPPPGTIPQHPSYDGSNGPAQPVQMGGHA